MNLAASQGKATVVSPTRLEVEGKASVKLVTLEPPSFKGLCNTKMHILCQTQTQKQKITEAMASRASTV